MSYLYTILSVDDSEMIQMCVEEALSPYQAIVIGAHDGNEALQKVHERNPDLILLDITMPNLNGVETLDELRKDPITGSIPVIMLTAESDRKTVMQVARLGVRDYICKPFSEELLVERILRILPLKLKTATASAPDSTAAAPVVATPPRPPATTIAVVEDKISIVERVQAVLADTDWTVSAHLDPRTAAAELEQIQPRCILLNLGIADDFAVEFYRQIRSSRVLGSVPVIGLSVKVRTDEQRRAREIGIHSIVTKPIDPLALKVTLLREMKLSLDTLYFKAKPDHYRITMPQGLNEINVVETSQIVAEALTNALINKSQRVLLDLRYAADGGLATFRILQTVRETCLPYQAEFQILATPHLCEQMKQVRETQDVCCATTEDELAGMTLAAA